MAKSAPKPNTASDADRRPAEPKHEAAASSRPSQYGDLESLRRSWRRGLHPDFKPENLPASRLPMEVVAGFQAAFRAGLRGDPLPDPDADREPRS